MAYTTEDIEWLLSCAESGRSCFDCELFEQCQEENRNYCEKEDRDDGQDANSAA